MKRILFVAIAWCLSMPAFSQNIKSQETAFEDYIPLLNKAGYQVYAFDISDFLNDTYHVNFKIKEYKDSVEVKDNQYDFGFSNRRMIKDFPEESQRRILEEGSAVNPEAGAYKQATKMTIGFSPSKSDSLKTVHFSINEMGSGSKGLKLQGLQSPDSDELFYAYKDRPFKLNKFEEGKFIPLVLYGSFWLDKKYNVFRFCGEREIDPDMSTEILKYIPHYYVIGVEFKKKE